MYQLFYLINVSTNSLKKNQSTIEIGLLSISTFLLDECVDNKFSNKFQLMQNSSLIYLTLGIYHKIIIYKSSTQIPANSSFHLYVH